MAAILRVFVLLPSFLHHLKALDEIYLLLCEYCVIGFGCFVHSTLTFAVLHCKARALMSSFW